MLRLYTMSPSLRSAGSRSVMETTSRASQVGPKTEQVSTGPFLKASKWYWQ
ncbi:MAG: hypothetical protein H6Q88_1579 [Anaeromyxobacteraceae bacterium]|nr:hypothetical protein [Anaeromyxobacteraceae bacterium]